MVDPPDDLTRAWTSLMETLARTGERLAVATEDLDHTERADTFTSMVRGLANQLDRFEVDREHPELVAFNEWRHKMFMDNPDFRYWVADIRDDRRYRVSGHMGDAVYMSITAYDSSGSLEVSASSRIDSDSIDTDHSGRFSVTLSRIDPGDGSNWLELPAGARVVWLRQFHHDTRADQLGSCRIDPLDDPPPSPLINPERLVHRLGRLERTMGSFPAVLETTVRDDLESTNRVRHWTEMTDGAVFTEPGIHYLRGSWNLDPGEVLVIDGMVPGCRYWNVLLYSRFLNSLDHRSRNVSYTSGTAQVVDGRYRFIISATDPGGSGDWLDNEERPFGLFVFRFLHPVVVPELPTLTRCRLEDL